MTDAEQTTLKSTFVHSQNNHLNVKWGECRGKKILWKNHHILQSKLFSLRELKNNYEIQKLSGAKWIKIFYPTFVSTQCWAEAGKNEKWGKWVWKASLMHEQ